MRVVATLVAVLFECASSASAEVAVRLSEGRVSLTASATPLAEVLERLSRQTGMKVVYEGAPPRQPVTVSFENRVPAEAILGILEGLGLNYALVMDPTGARVETLLMAGAAPISRGGPPAASPRPLVPAPPEPVEDHEEELAEGEQGEEADAQPAAPAEPPPPEQGKPPQGPTPLTIPVYPTSPFTPGPPAGPFVPLPGSPISPQPSPSPAPPEKP